MLTLLTSPGVITALTLVVVMLSQSNTGTDGNVALLPDEKY